MLALMDLEGSLLKKSLGSNLFAQYYGTWGMRVLLADTKE